VAEGDDTPAVLYDPAHFEPLSDERWDPARVKDAIGAIVADADAAFDLESLWPAHEWDAGDTPLPLESLYVGASGVIWALDALRRGGHAETSLDLTAAALRALERVRAEPDIEPGEEHYHPASLFFGETGPLLVAFRLSGDASLADDLLALLPTSAESPTDDVMWGIPGALLSLAGEPRWADTARELASELRGRRGEDGLWRQDDDYRGLGTLHGAAGNTLALRRVDPNESTAETAAVLARHAVLEDGLANWAGAPGRPLGRLQWCTGAPGILAGAWDYLDEELVLAGAELIWQAGARDDEKGHGLCHGTSGNGFALLKAFARTQDELWLERARRFAVHALGQVNSRYSLFTGDVGTALFAAACLDADARFPILDVL
jgi:lantibiotic modifying enzyme